MEKLNREEKIKDEIHMNKLIYKFAYDCVDSWGFDDLVEYAETKLIEQTKQRLEGDAETNRQMLEEMRDFWGVFDLDEVNPDDFKA